MQNLHIYPQDKIRLLNSTIHKKIMEAINDVDDKECGKIHYFAHRTRQFCEDSHFHNKHSFDLPISLLSYLDDIISLKRERMEYRKEYSQDPDPIIKADIDYVTVSIEDFKNRKYVRDFFERRDLFC